MAALIKHGLSKNNEISMNLLLRKSFSISCGCYGKHFKQKLKKVEVPQCRKLKSTEDSISSKGFLRCQKSYDPPSNITDRLHEIFKEVTGNESTNGNIASPTLKYALLSACFNEFRHGVPNSLLHTVNNFYDLLEFYTTPVNSTLPLDKMKSMDLPPNLHIQYEPLRFLPEEDTMFKGQTAFPKSNTLVSGIRTRRKYKGHKVTDYWPDEIRR